MRFLASYSDFTPRQGIVFSALIFIAGVVVLFFVWLPLCYKGWQSSRWPAVEGVITASRNWERDSSGSSRPSEVAYEYVVNGIAYSSKRVAFGSSFSNEKTGQDSIASRYPKDKKVLVYYQLKNPSVSVLEPGIVWGTFFLPGAAIFCLYLGAKGLQLHLRALKGENINKITFSKTRHIV